MLAALPLLAVVVLLYNVFALVTATPIAGISTTVALPSGAALVLTNGDLLVLAGLVLLYLEIFKATGTGVGAIVDHILSVVVFIVCLLELVMIPAMATPTFALITMMTLIDLVAGFTVTISSARRDFAVDERLR